MKTVWVKGKIDEHHTDLRGGTTKSIPVDFISEWGEKETLWIQANQIQWRKANHKVRKGIRNG